MVLFVILVLTAILLTVAFVIAIASFGAGAVLVFGDTIVCIAIIALLCWRILSRRIKD